MKTTRQRLLNIVIVISVVANLVLLGGLGYVASIANHVSHVYSAMNLPVVVYVPKASSSVAISIQSPAKR
jgi:hypothetical protein